MPLIDLLNRDNLHMPMPHAPLRHYMLSQFYYLTRWALEHRHFLADGFGAPSIATNADPLVNGCEKLLVQCNGDSLHDRLFC